MIDLEVRHSLLDHERSLVNLQRLREVRIQRRRFWVHCGIWAVLLLAALALVARGWMT